MQIKVNDQLQNVKATLDTPLLYVLRNELELNSPKFGCGQGQCGACTVLINNEAKPSCTTPLSFAIGKSITTLEGLGTEKKPHPLQQAFIEEQAMQCGYCVSGIIMNTVALLKKQPNPSESALRSALDKNLCRCGAHLRMLRAIRRVIRASA